MKKFLLIVLGGMLALSAFADEADKNGLISGWKFVPVQVGVGDFNSNNLFNQNSVAMFSLGLIGVKQYSSIISLGTISHLENNYGLQLSLLSLTNTNYGVMIGFENAAGHDENYGIKIGIFNVSGKFAKGQFIGVDFFDLLQAGVVNYHAPWQIGLINISEDSYLQIGIFNAANVQQKSCAFQLGLLNYNPNSYIPWMPLLNWDMR